MVERKYVPSMLYDLSKGWSYFGMGLGAILSAGGVYSGSRTLLFFGFMLGVPSIAYRYALHYAEQQFKPVKNSLEDIAEK